VVLLEEAREQLDEVEDTADSQNYFGRDPNLRAELVRFKVPAADSVDGRTRTKSNVVPVGMKSLRSRRY
jgi:hypothetical protein